MAEGNLGLVLMDVGLFTSGKQANDSLTQAAKYIRESLEVYSKADQPQDWERAQNALGLVLTTQGLKTSGPEAAQLFADSAKAYGAALEVITRKDQPQAWASIQVSLGMALMSQGTHAKWTEATDSMAQSVAAFHAALEVDTKQALPHAWASTQIFLALALTEQGYRATSSAQALALLDQALDIYRDTAYLSSKTSSPGAWALGELGAGLALTYKGERGSDAQAAESWPKAVEAYQGALEIFNKDQLPEYWATTQTYLGRVLADQGERATGAQATDLFNRAVEASRSASGVLVQSSNPMTWTKIQTNLSVALADQGDSAGASSVLDQCLQAFPTDVTVLRRAIFIDQEKLFRFDKAHDVAEQWLKVDPSPETRLDAAQEDLVTDRFDDCQKQAAAIGDASLPASELPLIPIRDAMKLACQWGAGQKAAALQTNQALSLKAAQVQRTDWTFAGTRHYLGSSAAFGTGRASWISLFDSLEKGDGAAMADALHQLGDAMKQ